MSKPYAVPIETVGVGDRVTVSWNAGSVKLTASGRVAAIHPQGKLRILTAEDGTMLASYEVDKPRAKTCMMHERYRPQDTPLFMMEE